MNFELWSDEYFQDLINRKIKHEIEIIFLVRHDRKPFYEEYHYWFKKFSINATCEVTNADIGVYDEDESKWYQKYKPIG